ncbi:MAG: UDP-N-acetylmuramoyl-L-alanyl-D-glutamate--2,6-diaminopimelate ligase [Marinilabiliales bacterium]|nr:MAG: UDP-N-acetylmuramoyl-L-alanyl-D-glutamate--2,6-diaminopimelate ligase [Marinilabiliales bacterium]
MKKLEFLLEDVDVICVKGDSGLAAGSLEFDSRRVSVGSIFFAIRGTGHDGHSFIESAVSKGAAAVICETMPAELRKEVCYVQVADSASALGIMASALFDHPSRRIKLTGVTGTNGKTTTATLLFRLFTAMGSRAGLISTVGYIVGEEKIHATHTTPDPVTINRLLSDMEKAGCEYCFMEVSSHAIVQQRIRGLHFAGGIFTNISHDHLDYHGSYNEYLKAKKQFFDRLQSGAFALVNKDDRNSGFMVQNTVARVKSFGMKSMADFRGSIVEKDQAGMLLDINGSQVWVSFIGEFNASNILAVFACGVLLGADAGEVLRVISTLTPVEGRFETIRSADGITVIVDYAHTPDALENVVRAIKQMLAGRSRLITVTGAGGDRDRGKRPVMAAIAAANSSKVILTSDNPRTEDPDAIINEMLTGIKEGDRNRVLCISNRKEAIRAACSIAGKGDFVLVAGKGHETYQEIAGVRHHFDDREVVRSAFNLNKTTG